VLNQHLATHRRPPAAIVVFAVAASLGFTGVQNFILNNNHTIVTSTINQFTHTVKIATKILKHGKINKSTNRETQRKTEHQPSIEKGITQEKKNQPISYIMKDDGGERDNGAATLNTNDERDDSDKQDRGDKRDGGCNNGGL
jgi:hypothetical protein